MAMRSRIAVSSAGWLLLCALTAQAQHWTFQMYGADLGLTNPSVFALHQDHDGFLWVSTEGVSSATMATDFDISVGTPWRIAATRAPYTLHPMASSG